MTSHTCVYLFVFLFYIIKNYSSESGTSIVDVDATSYHDDYDKSHYSMLDSYEDVMAHGKHNISKE